MPAVEPANQTVMQIARGYQLSQALYVAAKLGVADVLAAQPLDAEAIADAVGARAAQLRRVLRALVAAGVFSELEDGRFASNDAAAALRAGAPGGMRDVVVNFGEEMYRSFGELLHTVRTGETAFDRVYGAPAVRVLRGEPGDGGQRGRPHAGSNPARGARVRRFGRPARRADRRRCRRWDGNPGGGGPATPLGDRRRSARTARNARAREALPRRAGRGRSLPARRGRLLRVGPGRWRRLRPQERPARLGRRAVRRHPATLPCRDG